MSGGARPGVPAPLISIVMNCFNGEKYLREALDSIRGQTVANWELIFWDNQSTDRSAEILASYADPRFRYFYAPAHTLLYAARNEAIARSGGEFIAFLDVDDRWAATKLEKQLNQFSDSAIGFACSNYWIVHERERRTTLFRKRPVPQGWVRDQILEDYPVGMLTLMIRASALPSRAQACDSRFHIIGDLDLVWRLAAKWQMGYLAEPLAYYRLHGDNEGRRQKARHVDEFELWLGELAADPETNRRPAFQKAQHELKYMQGRLALAQGRRGSAAGYFKDLPWGKYKLKLLICLVRDRGRGSAFRR